MKSKQPPEDDSTVMAPSRPVSSVGYALLASRDNALPTGTMLGEFEITGLIGEGGFGIVYLAFDHALHREIALKEYMPVGLAARESGMTVVKSKKHLETFQVGLRSFINESRLLAKFDHPSLVKVHRFWEGNGTAYMVMPFYEGSTLKDTLQQHEGFLDERWLKQLLNYLLDALKVIHKEDCFHRDISPDNILILKNNQPLLLDFGAARRVINDMSQMPTAILKPGYAPIEQYDDGMSLMKQGAWTDIYALAAVIYFAVTGKKPVPAVSRTLSDSLVPLAKIKNVQNQYSAKFLYAIDKALAVRPEARPHTTDEFRTLLGLADTPSSLGSNLPELTKPKTTSSLAVYGFSTVFVLASIIGSWYLMQQEPSPARELILGKVEIDTHIAAADEKSPMNKSDAIATQPDSDTKEIFPDQLIAESESPVAQSDNKPPSTMVEMIPPKAEDEIALGLTDPIIIHEPKHEKNLEQNNNTRSVIPPQIPNLSPPAGDIPSRHGSPTNAVKKIIEKNKEEGRTCLANEDFECVTDRANKILQHDPDDMTAKLFYLLAHQESQENTQEAPEQKRDD